MLNPLRPLKYLPWIPLLQASVVTAIFAIAVDLLLFLSFLVPVVQTVALQLLNSPLAILIQLGAAVGVGALGVVVLKRWFRQIIVTNSVLWALVPCLLLCLFLKSVLGLPAPLLPGLDYTVLIGVVLGVFWRGRRY